MDEAELVNLISKDSSFLVAAHEMKAPLSIIRQLSLTLNDPEFEISQKERQRILAQIDLTSERALRIVSDLTKVARLEDAMFELSPINTKKVCSDIQREMAQIYALHGREIIFKNSARVANLAMANYDLLRSILLNFSDNALYAASKNSKVEVSVKNSGEKIRISVRDFGEELPLSIWRVVKKEQNKPVRAASRPQSSGLGIFIAQNFARAMGAQIGVIRHRNGSTFYVDLNRSEQLSLL
ncbi:MAG: HAMP domain-containing sensor histidine kinase [bacterium]|nr:HAMP domain-containing sensor histidine kinase [bacterium]